MMNDEVKLADQLRGSGIDQQVTDDDLNNEFE